MPFRIKKSLESWAVDYNWFLFDAGDHMYETSQNSQISERVRSMAERASKFFYSKINNFGPNDQGFLQFVRDRGGKIDWDGGKIDWD